MVCISSIGTLITHTNMVTDYGLRLIIEMTLRYISLLCAKENKGNVPSDYDSVKSVLQNAKYCRLLFDVLIENHRSLSAGRGRRKSTGIEISFLKRKNNSYVIENQTIH